MLSLSINKKIGGFTLIELLVVVAIIGILASVVLASLNTAREKARISGIRSEVLEFRKLMELEYSDNSSYANLNKSWVGTAPNQPCETRGYAGNYAAKAVEICIKIRSLMSGASANDFFTGVNTALGFTNNNDYAILARISSSGAQIYFSAGSSGRTSELCNGADNYIAPGCWSNP